MRFSTVAATLLPVGVAFAQTTHTVKVGGGGALAYDPQQLTGVANGDIVQFQFLSANHTATQSTFAAPCSNVTDNTGVVDGVDSGFQFVNSTSGNFPVWQITINNASAPIWMFCRQKTHCQMGMVFAINPTADKTYEAFVANAAKSTAVNGSPSSNSTASNSTSSAPADASSSSAPADASSTPSGTTATSNTGAPSASSASTDTNSAASNTDTSGGMPSAAATGASGNNNGAGAVRLGSGATLLSIVALAFGLLL